VAFTTDSGVGKSTLARVATDLGWQRVGDDLLPIAGRTRTISFNAASNRCTAISYHPGDMPRAP
jgi:ABC-type dipeptide/oligopeptide/nickel transport system ATPase subunit